MFKIKHFNDLIIDELYEISKCRYEVFACEMKITEENEFDDLDKYSYHIFLEKDNHIISYARILPKEFNNYGYVCIGRVLVMPKHRKNNIAKQMITSAVDFIQNMLNEEHIIIIAQEHVKEFYKSCNFKEISNVYIESGIPRIKMLL